MVLTTLRFHIHISEVLEILPFEQQKKDPFQQKQSNFLAGHCSEMVPTPPKRCFKDVSLLLGAFFLVLFCIMKSRKKGPPAAFSRSLRRRTSRWAGDVWSARNSFEPWEIPRALPLTQGVEMLCAARGKKHGDIAGMGGWLGG